jgi:uncharacterized protein YjbI with pentapeptide repeats
MLKKIRNYFRLLIALIMFPFRVLSSVLYLVAKKRISVHHIAYLLLIGGFAIIFLGFSYVHWETNFAPFAFINNFLSDFELRKKFVEEMYANGGAELLSISITVLLVDSLNKWRAEQQHKEELIVTLASNEQIIAKQAALMLKHKGWHSDGSLIKAKLYGCNLQGIDFESAVLNGSNMNFSNLQEAVFSDSSLRFVLLINADLTSADFRRSDLTSVIGHDANLAGAKLQKAKLDFIELMRANLSGANLIEASLRSANLSGVDLRNAILEDADLTNAKLSGATLPDGTKWDQDTDMERFTNFRHPNFWRSNQN